MVLRDSQTYDINFLLKIIILNVYRTHLYTRIVYARSTQVIRAYISKID